MNPETPQPADQPTTPPADSTPDFSPTPAETPAAPIDSSPLPDAAPTPVAPETPTPAATPLTSQAPETAPAPAPKDKKKIIILASVIGGVVLLAAIAAVLFFTLTAVSKQDYADASKQFNVVSRSSTDLSFDVSSLSSSSDEEDAEFNEDAKAVEDSIAKIKTENEALSKLKAVQVGEGKALYATFNDKLEAYLNNGETLLTSVKNLRPAMLVCQEAGGAKDVAARAAALKACSTSLNKISDLPNPEFKAFVDKIKIHYADYAKEYEAMSAIQNPFGANYEQYKTQRDKVYDIQDKIGEASDAFSDAIDKKDDELSVKNSADALADYLNEQQK